MGGQMGECPDWYPILRAARYLGVPPWDLAGIPHTAGCYFWVTWALAAENAEASAQRQVADRQNRRANSQRLGHA